MMLILMKMILKLLFMSDVWFGVIDLEKKLLKKVNKELMPVALHATRWWDWYMPEDKKGTEPFLIDKK